MATASLLTAQQRKICQTQSSQPAPNGPRAKALLSLDEGNTQQQAAQASGLSLGQVRYCLRRFRTVSLDLFDAATPTSSQPPVKTVAATTDNTTSKPSKDSKTSKSKKKDAKKGKDKKKNKTLKPIKPKTDKGNKKSRKKDKKGDGKKGKKKGKKK
ncbi:MAG: helix-turn-helix domain-containing protein [Pseudomonadota bacterium]|nr:helix-turn-helix domain-containing protein [Pseudomonadota bacterium]